MTDKATIETLYRIHWRSSITGETGHHRGTFSRDIGGIWVAALNRDEANKALGLTYWLELATKDEPNGVERG